MYNRRQLPEEVGRATCRTKLELEAKGMAKAILLSIGKKRCMAVVSRTVCKTLLFLLHACTEKQAKRWKLLCMGKCVPDSQKGSKRHLSLTLKI